MKRLSKEVNKDNKPVVIFLPPAKFFNYADNPKYPVASVFALNHYNLGAMKVRTSVVLKKFKSGAFETLNTFYKPIDTTIEVFHEAAPIPNIDSTEEQLPKAHSMQSVW
jgi:hypothetical protein